MASSLQDIQVIQRHAAAIAEQRTGLAEDMAALGEIVLGPCEHGNMDEHCAQCEAECHSCGAEFDAPLCVRQPAIIREGRTADYCDHCGAEWIEPEHDWERGKPDGMTQAKDAIERRMCEEES